MSLWTDLKNIVRLPLPRQNKPNVSVQQTPTARLINQPGTVTWQAGNFQEQVRDGYTGNDIVYAIIRLITDKVKLAPWYEAEIVDEVSYKRYNAIMQRPDLIKNWQEVEDLHKKALRQIDRGKSRISDLLTYPNEQDSWHDLVEAYAAFKLITGNTYIYAKMIPMGNNQGQPLELWALPTQYMSIIADLEVFPIIPTSYQLYMQYYQFFTKQEILHDKYFNPNWNIIGNQLYGLSPLQAAAKVITRSNEGKSAAVANYKNGGPAGILFMDDASYDPLMSVQEAIDIKKKLARNQGSANVNQVETSGYKVGYVPLGLSPVDLDLLNAENWDLRAICRIYGVPSVLLGDPEHNTYNNAKESEKALTLRCALPMLESIKQQFNRKLQSDWGFKGKNRIITYDPSVYQELQEDRKEQVSWLKDAPLQLRRKLEIMGESTEGYTEEQLNSIIIGAGMTTLDDVIMSQPVNPSLNDYER